MDFLERDQENTEHESLTPVLYVNQLKDLMIFIRVFGLAALFFFCLGCQRNQE